MSNIKVLVNDTLPKNIITLLEENKLEVNVVKVAIEQIVNYINKNEINILFTPPVTEIEKEILDNCPSLKIIAKTKGTTHKAVIDYALSKGIQIIDADLKKSQAIAEIVFAHLLSGVRFLYDSNRNMPLEGDSNFNGLKKLYTGGTELKGKTLGIIGLGETGTAVAKTALALGMKIAAYDKFIKKATIKLDFFDGQSVDFDIATIALEELYKESDFITIHLPKPDNYVITIEDFSQMKDNVGIINAAHEKLIEETALIDALDSGKVAFAGLDVFEEQPVPAIQVLMHPKISLSPNIASLTTETKERTMMELAKKVINNIL